MIFAIATPAAQAVASETKDIPMVFSAVTSAVDAGLTADNIAGTTDLNDIEKQIDLIARRQVERVHRICRRSQLVVGGYVYAVNALILEVLKSLLYIVASAIGFTIPQSVLDKLNK